MKKDLYREYCNDPEARKNNSYTRKGKHFFAGVENSSKDTVSTVTGGADEKIVARISTWKGAIEVEAQVVGGETLFHVSLQQHAGKGATIYRFCTGIIGDKDSIVLGAE